MASLSVRKLDDETYDRLRDRAARNGVSMEEEARQILKRAVSPPERIGDLFLKVFGPTRGADLNCLPASPTNRWISRRLVFWGFNPTLYKQVALLEFGLRRSPGM